MTAETPSLVRPLGFDHLVLRVHDVERSLEWYITALGLEPVRIDEWRAGAAPFPSVRISPETIIDLIPGESDPIHANVDHLCIVIAPVDFDDLVATAAFDVHSGPTPGLFGARGHATSLYVRDPDGNVVELRAYPES